MFDGLQDVSEVFGWQRPEEFWPLGVAERQETEFASVSGQRAADQRQHQTFDGRRQCNIRSSHSSAGGFVHPGREGADERGESGVRPQDRFHSGGVLRREAHQDCFQEVDEGVHTELGERRPRTELPQVSENCFGRNKK
jgi:hypothetical protein